MDKKNNLPEKEVEVTELRTDDFEDYYEMMRDEQLAKKTGFEPVNDEKKAHMLFESENDTNKTYAIRLINSGKLIGIINLFPEIGDNFEPDYENIELGYFINTSYQQHGYMTYALGYVVDNLKAPIKTVEATVEEHNVPSQKVLHTLDFTQVDEYDENLVFEREVK
ncbi:GNAT family N-acetyltransferase [Apilactobacillus kunkeei]|uniref:GNAT family N-acetyltransferase n=1 Tax=Apilactobacillus kunkeei TaxID=148814 RepID=UPI004033E52E